MHDPLREEQGDDPDRNVDEKNPVPTVVVSNPTAQSWANCGGDDNRHTINRKAHVPLFGGEGIGKDRLFAWSETAASKALHDAKSNQHGKAGGQPAKHGTQREKHHACHVKAFAANPCRKPAAHGEDDRVRNEIAGLHPCALIRRRSKIPGDVGQSNIRNRGIENLHEGRQRHCHGDHPRIEAG